MLPHRMGHAVPCVLCDVCRRHPPMPPSFPSSQNLGHSLQARGNGGQRRAALCAWVSRSHHASGLPWRGAAQPGGAGRGLLPASGPKGSAKSGWPAASVGRVLVLLFESHCTLSRLRKSENTLNFSPNFRHFSTFICHMYKTLLW